jgi:hypothetical protein
MYLEVARSADWPAPLIDKMLTGTFTDMLAATDEAVRADGSER